MNVITPDSKFMIWVSKKLFIYCCNVLQNVFSVRSIKKHWLLLSNYKHILIMTCFTENRYSTESYDFGLVFFLTVSESEQSIFNEIHSIIIFTWIVKVDNK